MQVMCSGARISERLLCAEGDSVAAIDARIVEAILLALTTRPLGYAAAHRRARRLSDSLAQRLRRPVKCRPGMDYTSCDFLETGWSSRGTPLPPATAPVFPDWEIAVTLSRRGGIATMLVRSWKGNVCSLPKPDDEIPRGVRSRLDTIRRWAGDEGLIEVPQACWELRAGRRRTTMDGVPANLFEVLFAEII